MTASGRRTLGFWILIILGTPIQTVALFWAWGIFCFNGVSYKALCIYAAILCAIVFSLFDLKLRARTDDSRLSVRQFFLTDICIATLIAGTVLSLWKVLEEPLNMFRPLPVGGAAAILFSTAYLKAAIVAHRNGYSGRRKTAFICKMLLSLCGIFCTVSFMPFIILTGFALAIPEFMREWGSFMHNVLTAADGFGLLSILWYGMIIHIAVWVYRKWHEAGLLDQRRFQSFKQ